MIVGGAGGKSLLQAVRRERPAGDPDGAESVPKVAVPLQVRLSTGGVTAFPERVIVNTIGSLPSSAPVGSVAATETVAVPSLSVIEPVAFDGLPTV